MKPVNVLFALKDSHYDLLKQNFQRDSDGNRLRTDLTDAQARALRNNYDGAWPTVTIGADTYHILSFTFPEIWENPNDITAGHKWIEFLLSKWPTVWIIIGCWQRTHGPFSLHWGQYYDEEGVVQGVPVYPLHAQHMRIMFDPEGNPSPVPVDMNLPLGWGPRVWE